MRLICTSNVELGYDPTVHDAPTHHAVTFGAAEVEGHDPADGPAPSASVYLTMPADEAADFAVGSAWEIYLEPADGSGTVAEAEAQADEHPEGFSPSPEADQPEDAPVEEAPQESSEAK